MVTAIKTVGELKVGDGWRYQCLTCNFEVGVDKAFPKECPGCHAPGWWGCLTPSVLEKLNQKTEDGISIKNSEAMMPGGIKIPYRILSQPPGAVVHGEAQNNGIFEPSLGQGRGRPRQTVPENLIMELNSQGFSSRAMAAILNEQGIAVSYKTIQRRLQASSL